MKLYVSSWRGSAQMSNVHFKSQKYHLENPYWKTFDPYVMPLLEKPMDLRRHEELDTIQDTEVPF